MAAEVEKAHDAALPAHHHPHRVDAHRHQHQLPVPPSHCSHAQRHDNIPPDFIFHHSHSSPPPPPHHHHHHHPHGPPPSHIFLHYSHSSPPPPHHHHHPHGPPPSHIFLHHSHSFPRPPLQHFDHPHCHYLHSSHPHDPHAHHLHPPRPHFFHHHSHNSPPPPPFHHHQDQQQPPHPSPFLCARCKCWNFPANPNFNPYPYGVQAQELLPPSTDLREEGMIPPDTFDGEAEEDDDESYELVMTDEWVEFFAQSEARRQAKKRQQKQAAKDMCKASKAQESSPADEELDL